jgi:hypothetical protein
LVRIAAGIIGAFDTVAWLFLLTTYFWSDGDPATRGWDAAAAGISTGLFATTAAPALALAALDRALRTALVLALAFPTIFVLLLLFVAYTLP